MLDYFKTLGKTSEMKTDLDKSIKSTRSSMMLVTSIDTSPVCNILDSPNALSKGPMEATIILVSAQHNSTLISQMMQVTCLSLIILLPTMPRNTPHATSTPVSKRNESEEVISFIPNLPGGKTA